MFATDSVFFKTRGRRFQRVGATTEKTRPPLVLSLDFGTIQEDLDPDGVGVVSPVRGYKKTGKEREGTIWSTLPRSTGSLSAEVPDIEKIAQYFEDMKTKLTQELTETIQAQDLASKAQTFLDERRTQLEPIVAQIQEQLKSAAANVEEQIKPMAANVQSQVQPLVDDFQRQVEAILRKLMDQTKAIAN
ncbi:uncharacterized protein ACN63O_018074 [Diretmus argenteus]